MHQDLQKFTMFRNRLEKVNRRVSKQAAREGVSCFRIYDHDIPEFPLLIERYDGKIYVSEYKRKHNLDEEAYDAWLQGSVQIIAAVTGIEIDQVYSRLRKRKEGRGDQYQKATTEKVEFTITENGLNFIVNLTEYLDTGLFLDHRITRSMVRERSAGKKVLNLFCYTGSFSVYALAGGAALVKSVDLSKTYLQWTDRNVELNFPGTAVHESIHADAIRFLQDPVTEKFDIIVMDPPTFSNSKRMDGILDIQKDHVTLINQCLARLEEGGLLYFSTNYRKFAISLTQIKGSVKDITKATTPFDFVGKLFRYCFLITK